MTFSRYISLAKAASTRGREAVIALHIYRLCGISGHCHLTHNVLGSGKVKTAVSRVVPGALVLDLVKAEPHGRETPREAIVRFVT
jgi:hypothetical protein